MFFFLTMATSEHNLFIDKLDALKKEMVPDPISCVDAALLDRTLFPLKQRLVSYLVLDGKFQKTTERKYEDEVLFPPLFLNTHTHTRICVVCEWAYI